jgi:hypothetical protein
MRERFSAGSARSDHTLLKPVPMSKLLDLLALRPRNRPP